MNPLIKGIHHAGIKPAKKDFDKVVGFYTEILGFDKARSWIKEGIRGTMLSVGNGNFMEIIESDKESVIIPDGAWHLAFHVTDTDAMIEKVRREGYEILAEPKDVCLPSELPYPIRVGFCRGPAGEEIEFFSER